MVFYCLVTVMRDLTPSKFSLVVDANSSEYVVRHRAEQLESNYEQLVRHSKEFARIVVEAEVLLDEVSEGDFDVLASTVERLSSARNEVALYKTRVESLLGHVPADAERYADSLSRLSRGLGVIEERCNNLQSVFSEKGLSIV